MEQHNKHSVGFEWLPAGFICCWNSGKVKGKARSLSTRLCRMFDVGCRMRRPTFASGLGVRYSDIGADIPENSCWPMKSDQLTSQTSHATPFPDPHDPQDT